MNIILIETDQQRHDTIGAHGNPHMITPNLDRIAGDYAEYYDMAVDPWEETNLYDSADHQSEIVGIRARLLDWLLVSRYQGSLPQIGRESRSIWSENHPEDPYVLHSGCVGNNKIRL